MPNRKVLQSLSYTMFAYKIPSPQEVCPSLPRDIRMKGTILYRFWMGFLLFLPAYVHSPGGIIIFGPKREGGHWINHMMRSHVTSPHVPTLVTPNQEGQSRLTGSQLCRLEWSLLQHYGKQGGGLGEWLIFLLWVESWHRQWSREHVLEPQEAVAFRAIPSVYLGNPYCTHSPMGLAAPPPHLSALFLLSSMC